jgi:hypothetical protein
MHLCPAVQMFVIKNLDTGLEMRIDDFDRIAHIATDPDPDTQVLHCITLDCMMQTQHSLSALGMHMKHHSCSRRLRRSSST